MAEEAKEKAAPDGRGKRSRREVMAGAAGVLGVLAVQTLGKATPAQAGTDGDVVLGENQQLASGTTGVVTTESTYALHGQSTGQNGGGVLGEGDGVGVRGDGVSFGVYGRSSGYIGVGGVGGTYGVQGDVSATGGANGVYGHASNSGGSGVYGQNDSTGYGVAGRAPNGTGVLADSASGTALQVTGKAVFSRSGRATVTVASGKSYVQVSLGNLTSSTFVVATVQGNPAGIWVKSVAVTPANGYFRIYLNKVPTVDIRVGWFVLG